MRRAAAMLVAAAVVLTASNAYAQKQDELRRNLGSRGAGWRCTGRWRRWRRRPWRRRWRGVFTCGMECTITQDAKALTIGRQPAGEQSGRSCSTVRTPVRAAWPSGRRGDARRGQGQVGRREAHHHPFVRHAGHGGHRHPDAVDRSGQADGRDELGSRGRDAADGDLHEEGLVRFGRSKGRPRKRAGLSFFQASPLRVRVPPNGTDARQKRRPD